MRVLCTFLCCLLVFSSTSIAQKTPSEATKRSKKLEFQEDPNERDIPTFNATTRGAAQGDVPIINPTTPGSANPNPSTTSPLPPFDTSPTNNPGPWPNTNPAPSNTNNPGPPNTNNPGPNNNPGPPNTNNPGPNNNPGPPNTNNPGPNNNPGPPNTNNPGPNNNPGPPSGAWCVASPTASPTALQVGLDYACGFGGADCSALQPGGSCYEPNTAKDHASYAYNDYYQKNPAPTSCDFGGTAQLTYTDPSNGNCHYASPRTTSLMPPPAVMPPPAPTTTSGMPPPSTGGQNGFGSEPTDYGAEPTGSPNEADSLSKNVQLLFAMTSFAVVLSAYCV